MAKVFIANDTGLDYSKASIYGDLVPVTRGSLDVFNPTRLQIDVVNALRNFTADDFLLVSGGALATAFAIQALSLTELNSVKLLLFDSKKRDYFMRTIPLDP